MQHTIDTLYPQQLNPLQHIASKGSGADLAVETAWGLCAGSTGTQEVATARQSSGGHTTTAELGQS